MNSDATHPVTKTRVWSIPVICTVAFLGFIAVVFMNIPPFVKSNHVSVKWTMLFIAGFGAVGSVMVLAAMLFFPISKKIGKAPAGIIGVEATAALILSIVLLYKSLDFFGMF